MINFAIRKRDEMYRAHKAALETEQFELAELFHIEYEHYVQMVKMYETK